MLICPVIFNKVRIEFPQFVDVGPSVNIVETIAVKYKDQHIF